MWRSVLIASVALVSALGVSGCDSTEPDNTPVPSSQLSSNELTVFRERIIATAYAHYEHSLLSTQDLQRAIDLFAQEQNPENLMALRLSWRRSLFNHEQAYAFAIPGSVLDMDGEGQASWVIGPVHDGADIERVLSDNVAFPGITAEILIAENDVSSGKQVLGYNALEYLLFHEAENMTLWENPRRGTYLKVIGEMLVELAQKAVDEWAPDGAQSQLMFSESEQETRQRYAAAVLRQTERILIRREFYDADTSKTRALGALSRTYHMVESAGVHGLSNLLFNAAPAEPAGELDLREKTISSALEIAPKLDAKMRDALIKMAIEKHTNTSPFLTKFALVHDAETRLFLAGAASVVCSVMLQQLQYFGHTVHISGESREALAEIGVELTEPLTEESLQQCVVTTTSQEFFDPIDAELEEGLNELRDYLMGADLKPGQSAIRGGGSYYSTATVEDQDVSSDVAVVAITLL